MVKQQSTIIKTKLARYIILLVGILIAVLTYTSALAQRYNIQEEIRMAAEGGPADVVKDATYMAFENGEFVEIQKGSNNFTCLVVRHQKGRYEPSCFNIEARRSIMPTYEMHMRLLYEGYSIEETMDAIAKAYELGDLPTAETASLVYMMSPNNKFYDWANDRLLPTPRHHMYYFPKLEKETFSLEEGMPYLYQGYPHLTALIVPVGKH